MGNVYLVPIDHRVQMNEQLVRLYNEFKPKIIISEGSEELHGQLESICLDLEESTQILGHEKARQLGDTFRDLTVQFPVNTNLQYSRLRGFPHEFVSTYNPKQYDDLGYIREIANSIKRVINQTGIIPNELLAAIEEDLLDKSRLKSPINFNSDWLGYQRRERGFRHEIMLLKLKRVGYIGKADYKMEQRIRQYVNHSNIVFAVGMVHATDSLLNLTLYSRIKDLKPIRLQLG